MPQHRWDRKSQTCTTCHGGKYDSKKLPRKVACPGCGGTGENVWYVKGESATIEPPPAVAIAPSKDS